VLSYSRDMPSLDFHLVANFMTHATGHLGVRLEKIDFQVGDLFNVPSDKEGRFGVPSLEEICVDAVKPQTSMTAWQLAHPPTTRYGQRVAFSMAID